MQPMIMNRPEQFEAMSPRTREALLQPNKEVQTSHKSIRSNN